MKTFMFAIAYLVAGASNAAEFNNLDFDGEPGYIHLVEIYSPFEHTLFYADLTLSGSSTIDTFRIYVDDVVELEMPIADPYWTTAPLPNVDVTQISPNQALIHVSFLPGLVGNKFRGEFVSIASNVFIDQLKFNFVPEPNTIVVSIFCVICCFVQRKVY